MVEHPLNQTAHQNSFSGIRSIKTVGHTGLVCGANLRPNLLEGGGSCDEAENQSSDALDSLISGVAGLERMSMGIVPPDVVFYIANRFPSIGIVRTLLQRFLEVG